MTDKLLVDRLEQALAGLSNAIQVIPCENDANQALLPDGVRLPWDQLTVARHMRYLPLQRRSLCLACAEAVPGGEDLLRMAEILTQSLSITPRRLESTEDIYRRTLQGELMPSELEAMTAEYKLQAEFPRCVILFQGSHVGNMKLGGLLTELMPLQERDVLVEMNRHIVVLIKDLSDEETLDDMIQFSEALQETVMTEAAWQLTVGIGSPLTRMDELQRSYREARRAIEVGRVFQPEQSVYAYTRLSLERLLLEIPPEVAARYHQMLFNPQNEKLFNEEMLYTIDMFFRKDLNLSDTARQLYIHRNTLVYRLDKVQKQLGLDLRSFRDAVTFMILMELKKCGTDGAGNK